MSARKEVIVLDKGILKLIEDMENLFGDGKTGDISFKVGPEGELIRCHSFMLKQRCKDFKGETNYVHFSPTVFRAFMMYVYTGKLCIDDCNLVEVFCLATEFGMEDLQVSSEKLILHTLNSANVFKILESALQLNKTDRSGLPKVISRCIDYIGENAKVFLSSPEFLSLSLETLIAIISSDQLCLEEDEVWRLVLKWAQYHAQVPTHVSSWTKEEKMKVSKYLSPVISHVRMLLIDSSIFASEVEPTGCVPMALSLERYRFAAIPSQFKETDPRRAPRNTPRLFRGSNIIDPGTLILGKYLNDWLNSPKQVWKCVFRGSQHGFSARAFHSHVDGLFPTYVIVLLQNQKWICGGYSDIAWTSSKSSEYVKSHKSFLFSFDGDAEKKQFPVKFSIKKKHFAINLDSCHGPIWGAGADLFISDLCHTSSNSYSNLHSYEPEKEISDDELISQPLLTPSYNFLVSEYEVFIPA